MKKLKLAIIGCGSISIERHIPSALKNKKIDLVAICDIDEDKLKILTKRFKISKYYFDYKEMLEKEEIDIVDIATPLQVHKEQALTAIGMGKHVIVEKPMAATSKEADEIINSARKKGIKLSVYHTMKAYPIVEEIKRIIENKELGNISLLNFLTTYGTLQPWLLKQKWGALWEIGIHRIYLTDYLLSGIKEVEAESYDGQKNFSMTFFSENGVGEVHIVNSGFDKASDFLTIYGEKGKIIAQSLEFNTFVKMNKEKENWLNIFEVEIINNMKVSFNVGKRGFQYVTKGVKILPHFLILDNFVDAILNSGRLLVPPEEGVRTIQILEEVEKKLNKSVR